MRSTTVILSLAALSQASAFLAPSPLAFRAASHGAFAAPLRSTTIRPAHMARATSLRAPALKMQEEDAASPLERVCAILPYALPLSDVFTWGRYLFAAFPLLALPFVPLFPVMQLLNAPFVSFGVFIALSVFVTRNPSLPRFVRYNTMQAIYLDIVLIFPQLLGSINSAITGGTVAPELAEVGSNTVFYAVMGAILYSAIKSAFGKYPNEIPLISEAVDSQIPF